MDAACEASLPFIVFLSLLKLMSIELMMPSNHFSQPHPHLLLPSVLPSIRMFSNESALYIRWSKYQSFIFSFSPSCEYSGLISFRIDWFDLLAVQRNLKSLLQHHSSKVSILLCSVSLWSSSHICTRLPEKNIALTRWTLVSKLMSLFFNILSKFVIVFIPRSKHLLILWLQSPSTVILELKKMKSVTVSTFYPSICHDFPTCHHSQLSW